MRCQCAHPSCHHGVMSPFEPLPPTPTRPPDFADDFADGPNPALWVAHYLPQWSTPERSAARIEPGVDGIHLRIDEAQPDWRPEDAPLRVSNLQTGVFSGPVGSTRGTHRHRPDGLVVRTPTPTRLLFAPSSGRFDITVSASTDEGCMTAAWLVGTEHRSTDESGEICVFEIDAEAIRDSSTTARAGIKAHHDPRLVDDMSEVTTPVVASRPHTWTVIWGEGETIIGCAGSVVRRIAQAPDYPLFLMIDLFELRRTGGGYPKRASVHEVRGWEGSVPTT